MVVRSNLPSQWEQFDKSTLQSGIARILYSSGDRAFAGLRLRSRDERERAGENEQKSTESSHSDSFKFELQRTHGHGANRVQSSPQLGIPAIRFLSTPRRRGENELT